MFKPTINSCFVWKFTLDWPADAGGSETLMKVLDKLDTECARRCELWELQDTVKLALIWVRYSFRCVFNDNHKHFETKKEVPMKIQNIESI